MGAMPDYDNKCSRRKDCMCISCCNKYAKKAGCSCGGNHGKEKKINKKGSSGVVILILLIIFIFLTSTQKVEFNNKQITTATAASCNLIKEQYDPINRICVKQQNVQQTNSTP